MTERMIQVVIARADLILCAMLRWAVFMLCIVILAVCVWAARECVERRDLIDYDSPGVDITTEGP